MKILNIFCDMLRPDTLKIYNDKVKQENILDAELKKLGGTVYQNVFAVNPDTGRGIAGFFTGKFAKYHGCQVMGQYPEKFLNNDLYNLNDLLKEKGVKNYFLCKEDYYKLGYFPKDTDGLVKILESKRNDYKEQIKMLKEEINKSEDIFIFLTFSDFHDVMSLENYNSSYIDKGKEKLGSILKYTLETLGKDNFDYIFLFSDHGCCYINEEKKKEFLIDSNRSRITLQVRKKYEVELKKETSLRSLLDLFPTWCYLYNKKVETNGICLFQDTYNRKIAIESSSKFATDIWATSDIWAVITEKEIILKSNEKQYVLENKIIERREISTISLSLEEIDEILKAETIFYKNEKEFFIKKDEKAICKRIFYSDGSFWKIKGKSYMYIYLRYLIAKTAFYDKIRNLYKKYI